MHNSFAKHLLLSSFVSLLSAKATEQINPQLPVEKATSQSAENEEIKSAPSSVEGSHENRKLKPNPANPVRILEPNPNDESQDDHVYKNPLIESGEFYKPRKPFLHATPPKLYKPHDPLLPSIQSLPVPLTNVSADRLEWSMIVAEAVNEYFRLAYDEMNKDSPFYALQCPDGTVVNRPNHSLAHGLRQAYLAVDIAVLLKHANGRLYSSEGQALYNWVLSKFKSEPLFLKQIEFANAFQRTGRKSELGRDQNEKKYEEYLRADQENFQHKAADHIGEGKLFKNQAEVNVFKDAIVKKFDKREPGISEDIYFLSKIMYSAHLLDLRRLPHFSKDKILKNISKQLFGTENPNEEEQQLITKLWARSGDYLAATGDRDMDDPQKSSWDPAVFCAQAHNPKLLVHALQIARAKSETKLLKSIDAHTQAIRKLKEPETVRGIKEKNKIAEAEERAIGQQTEKQQKATEFRNILEEAPYTASEGYLKILLEEKYTEIPKAATEDEARQITTKNVKMFLAEPKRVKDPKANEKVFLPRIDNPDEEYINTLVDCMMEERKNRGKIALYHTTEPETGFIYDVYTQLRNQLLMEGGNDIRALRATDEAFLMLDGDVQEEQAEGEKAKANVGTFMHKFKGVADDDRQYQDMVLSTNFSLFGSDQQINADTYNMFYKVKSEPISTSPVNGPKFFEYIESQTGIPVKYEQYKPIMTQYIAGCEHGNACRTGNGRLIQIFIDPEVLVDMTYFSVLLGAPVLKEGATPNLDIPIKLLRTEPTKLIKYLENTSGGVVRGARSHLLRPNTLELHDLQARFFMRPEIMFDTRFTTVKSYWRFGPSKEIKTYYDKIKGLVSHGLVEWLHEGGPAQPDAFAPETVKLKKFTQMVYKGSTGIKAPEALPTPIESQFIRLIQGGRGEQAASMLEDHYDALLNQTFIIHPDRKGQGGGQYSLTELIKSYQFPSLIKVAFQKGIFKGGDEAYQVALLIEYRYEMFEFLNALSTFKNPSETSRLFVQHFKSPENSYSIVTICEALNFIHNDESIIALSKPLFNSLNNHCIDKILKGVYQIPELERKNIVEKTLSLLSQEDPHQIVYAARDIEHILSIVMEMKNLEPQQQDYILSVGKQIQYDWSSRVELMRLLHMITWVSDPREKIYGSWISAPFKADDVVKHARTKPEIYDMDFLESKEGGLLIAEIINKLNAHMVPQDDFASLSSAYNRGSPSAGYNKSLIADYASSLKMRLDVMKILQKITWVPDPREKIYGSWISAPFSAKDVIDHANTKPEIYDMEFLESPIGLRVISEIIKKLDAHMVPQDDFASLSLAYNRSRPDAGYNKSLIADYASTIKNKRYH